MRRHASETSVPGFAGLDECMLTFSLTITVAAVACKLCRTHMRMSMLHILAVSKQVHELGQLQLQMLVVVAIILALLLQSLLCCSAPNEGNYRVLRTINRLCNQQKYHARESEQLAICFTASRSHCICVNSTDQLQFLDIGHRSMTRIVQAWLMNSLGTGCHISSAVNRPFWISVSPLDSASYITA